ncbi:CRISPR-associated protein Cas4 [Deinococcus cellulosilyticus]|uniref:CRISPR-associated exonuclease Cas4 n=1 Tax=Deinococcus cellulosilyticus (strain DSM 18568 / NBRC 106333 / KACC 11606 / 5516J-15) TaxID=1223518 RepID=A0A511N0D8_DEIC1|nr:CRISPR-associated protein Cas4 [Deinococcus cellulosilyticus]GEM46314.1 CRISPR-associated protein Cas4 [Deinococcus cellulosilyticus NBRC 106333 = KACC 11606]
MQVVSLSALQHYLFCPRQCALIHVEQVWEDNLYTERGNRQHQKVDVPRSEKRPGVRQEYAMPLWSESLQLSGKGDLIEFLKDGTPYPVEHKVGRKLKLADQIQLCAQALCLEDMFQRPVPSGALFYHSIRTRKEVEFTPELRQLTLDTIDQTRNLLENLLLPRAQYDERCTHCSLIDLCLPEAHQVFEPEDPCKPS